MLDDYNPMLHFATCSHSHDDVKDMIQDVIKEVPSKIFQVGMRLMKFCAKWDMQRIADPSTTICTTLTSEVSQ